MNIMAVTMAADTVIPIMRISLYMSWCAVGDG